MAKPHYRLPWLRWITGGILVLFCGIALLSYFRGLILLQQEGVLTQSTIVATSSCSLYSMKPDSSPANQGVFLTVMFSDESGRLHQATLSGCLPRIYVPGESYAIKYVPSDPSLVAGANSSTYQSSVPVIFFAAGLVGGGLGLVLVIVGTVDLLQQVWLYRSLRRNRLLL
jgi:hypothetical protein